MSTAPLDIEAVKKVIEHHKMLENCGGVVAAVSGGCDSSVLLHVLWRLSTEMGFKILCAHINHNLRGSESERDEAFVRSLCEKYGIECRVLSANVADYAEKHRLSTEEAAMSFLSIVRKNLAKTQKLPRRTVFRTVPKLIYSIPQGALPFREFAGYRR